MRFERRSKVLRRIFRVLGAVFIAGWGAGLGAAPSDTLTLPETHTPKSSEQRVRSVHEPIAHRSETYQNTRTLILKSLLAYPDGPPWLLEGEGDGYIVARWRHRDSLHVHRIEYSEALVQIKHQVSWGRHRCKRASAGICVYGDREYYETAARMRQLLVNTLDGEQ